MSRNSFLLSSILFFLFVLNFSSRTFAAANGPYIGGQLGWGNVHQGEFISDHLNDLIEKAIPGLSSKTESLNILYNNTGLAGRIFAGYQFNRYFATEVGYYRFSKLDLDTSMHVNLDAFKKYNLPVDISSHAAVNTYAIDLVGKGILPVTDKLSFYGKLGLAYLNADGTVNITAKSNVARNIDASIGVSGNPSVNVIYPTFGLGMSYDMTKNLSADLSWSHIQQYNSRSFPSLDFVGVGVLYHFDTQK